MRSLCSLKSSLTLISSLAVFGLAGCSQGEENPIDFREDEGSGGAGSGGAPGSGGRAAGSGGAGTGGEREPGSGGSCGTASGSGGVSGGSGGVSGGSGGQGTGGGGVTGPALGELFGPCDETDTQSCGTASDGTALNCRPVDTTTGTVRQCINDLNTWCTAASDDAGCAVSDIYGKGTPQCTFFPDPWWVCTLGCSTTADCPTGLECKAGSLNGGPISNMCVPLAP